MKNMIYALTRQQVREKANDVTRRMGCLRLKHGEWFYRIMKCLGFRTEERVKKIDGAVIIVFKRSKPLRLITNEPDSGREEYKREEFQHLSFDKLVSMFCLSHRSCTPDSIVTRIEFSYEG